VIVCTEWIGKLVKLRYEQWHKYLLVKPVDTT